MAHLTLAYSHNEPKGGNSKHCISPEQLSAITECFTASPHGYEDV